MATPTQRPGEQEPDDHMCSEPVGDHGTVVCQSAVGKDRVIGGGEYPDKDRPPDEAAPGEDGTAEDPVTGSTRADPAAGRSGPPPGGADPMAGSAPSG